MKVHRILLANLLLLSASAAWCQNDTSSPEQQVRAALAQWQEHMNASDAKGIAASFTEEGELTDETGRTLKGREAIEGFLGDFFAAFPKTTCEIEIIEIRPLSPEVMLADGHRTSTSADSGASATTRFAAVFAKVDNAWEIGSWRELEDKSARNAGAQLKALEWMVGEWVNEQPEAEIHLDCRWSEDKNFLLREFRVVVGGEIKVKSSQRIGWDPVLRQIRSWNFDSDGGFGDGIWFGNGDRWLVRTNSVLADGRSASALHFLTRDGTDKVRWESTARIVGDVLEPDRQATMVRRPPEPGRE